MLQGALEVRTHEVERLHALLAEEQQIVRVLTNQLDALPGPVRGVPPATGQKQTESSTLIHTYASAILSSFLPLLPAAGVIAFLSLAWRGVTIDDPVLEWAVIALLLVAVIIMLLARALVKRLKILLKERVDSPTVSDDIRRNTQLFLGLEILGLVLFVVSTVLMWTN